MNGDAKVAKEYHGGSSLLKVEQSQHEIIRPSIDATIRFQWVT